MARAAGRAWSAGQGARRCTRARAPRQRPATEAGAASGRRRMKPGGGLWRSGRRSADNHRSKPQQRGNNRATARARPRPPTEPRTEPGQAAPPGATFFKTLIYCFFLIDIKVNKIRVLFILRMNYNSVSKQNILFCCWRLAFGRGAARSAIAERPKATKPCTFISAGGACGLAWRPPSALWDEAPPGTKPAGTPRRTARKAQTESHGRAGQKRSRACDALSVGQWHWPGALAAGQ